MASMALGEGPRGFSFDASFATRIRPYCLRTLSIVRPASYGRNDSMYGGTSGTAFILALAPCRVGLPACPSGGESLATKRADQEVYRTYCTATVTPFCVVAEPTVITMGTDAPVGAFTVILRFTCITPEINVAALPAYSTFACTPPTVALTIATGLFSADKTGAMIKPSTPGGEV